MLVSCIFSGAGARHKSKHKKLSQSTSAKDLTESESKRNQQFSVLSSSVESAHLAVDLSFIKSLFDGQCVSRQQTRKKAHTT